MLVIARAIRCNAQNLPYYERTSVLNQTGSPKVGLQRDLLMASPQASQRSSFALSGCQEPIPSIPSMPKHDSLLLRKAVTKCEHSFAMHDIASAKSYLFLIKWTVTESGQPLSILARYLCWAMLGNVGQCVSMRLYCVCDANLLASVANLLLVMATIQQPVSQPTSTSVVGYAFGTVHRWGMAKPLKAACLAFLWYLLVATMAAWLGLWSRHFQSTSVDCMLHTSSTGAVTPADGFSIWNWGILYFVAMPLAAFLMSVYFKSLENSLVKLDAVIKPVGGPGITAVFWLSLFIIVVHSVFPNFRPQ